MVRMSLTLPEELHERLRKLAAARGEPLSSVIREFLEAKAQETDHAASDSPDRVTKRRPRTPHAVFDRDGNLRIPASVASGASGKTDTARRSADELPSPPLRGANSRYGPAVRLARPDGSRLRSVHSSDDSSQSAVIVPAPVLVEVDQLLQRMEGFDRLLRDIQTGYLQVEDLTPVDYARIRAILTQYADTPIGFVDAAVLAVTERLGETRLATLDRHHFGLLRPAHVDALTLVP
jgi:predicted nucleic acid-binding protein